MFAPMLSAALTICSPTVFRAKVAQHSTMFQTSSANFSASRYTWRFSKCVLAMSVSPATDNGLRTTDKSQVILEISLGPHPAAHPEHVGRHDVRVQLDVVARPVPQVAGVAQQLVQLVGLVPVE